MLDHIGLQVQDVEKSLDFYLRTFAPIGMRELMRFPYGETIVVGLGGADGQPVFWLGPPTGQGCAATFDHITFRPGAPENLRDGS